MVVPESKRTSTLSVLMVLPETSTEPKLILNSRSEVTGNAINEPLYLALSTPPKMICPVAASGELR
ncbi:Uncharacterised protein [Chlamydia trachomatis]|nr:Uncharacterised protein [Chlamydia trachomatis]